MYAIQGDFRRFCFDRAVLTFGAALEAALEEVKGKTDDARARKRQRVLDTWLGRELKYRNPVGPTRSAEPSAAPKSEIEQEFTMRGDGSEWGG